MKRCFMRRTALGETLRMKRRFMRRTALGETLRMKRRFMRGAVLCTLQFFEPLLMLINGEFGTVVYAFGCFLYK